jgi:hypothetical protein
MHPECSAPLCLSMPLVAGLGLFFLPVEDVAAQQQRMMIVADGDGPQVMHFTGPEMAGLRQPDFVRRDLPIFVERLQLGNEQAVMVQMMLEAYLEAFKALEIMLPQHGPVHGPAFLGTRTMRHDGGPGEMGGFEGGDGQFPGEIGVFVQEMAGGEGTEDMDVTFTAGGPVAIAIQARAGEGELPEDGAGGPQVMLPGMEEGNVFHVEAVSGGPDGPTAGVVLSMVGADGEELSPEVKEQLQKRAQELVERLKKHMEEAAAAGEDQAAALPGPESIERHRQEIEEFRDAAARFRKAADQLREEFLAQVRNELTADQAVLWPGFERAIRRVKTLPLGRLDGERTDLFSVIESITPATEERAALGAELEGYELALDEALRARNEYLTESETRLSAAINGRDFERAMRIADEAARLRVAVRGVNEQFTVAMAGKFEAARGEEFRKAALKRSFPRVYRATAAQKAFAEAAGTEGLDPQVRASVEALRDAYESELASANERLREAIRRSQPAEPREAMAHVAAVMASAGTGQAPPPPPGARGDDPVREAFAKRRELGERYMAQLKSVLPPEPAAAP